MDKVKIDYNYSYNHGIIKGKAPRGEYGYLGKQVTLESFEPGETASFKKYPCEVKPLDGDITLEDEGTKYFIKKGSSIKLTKFKICPFLLHPNGVKKNRVMVLIIRFPNSSAS